jgi:hypothetical protein
LKELLGGLVIIVIIYFLFSEVLSPGVETTLLVNDMIALLSPGHQLKTTRFLVSSEKEFKDRHRVDLCRSRLMNAKLSGKKPKVHTRAGSTGRLEKEQLPREVQDLKLLLESADMEAVIPGN